MHTIARVIAIAALATWVGTAAAQVCDDFNPCTTGDMCGEEGCNGTPATGGGCDDSNPCTVNDRCTPLGCMGDSASPGTVCAGGCGTCEQPFPFPGVPTSCVPKPEVAGDPCEPLNVGGVNPCLEGACLPIGDLFVTCFPTFKDCPDTDGNKCTDFCNPANGQCETNGSNCIPQCETCNPTTGACQPANLGGTCEDFDVCTTQSRCEALEGRGLCLAGIPSVATATPTAPAATPTAPAATPTAPLATATPRPPTATAQVATPTRTTAPPTATTGVATATPGTPAATSTPGGESTPTAIAMTPTPGAGGCVGDCNSDGFVRVNELIQEVNIALGLADLSLCIPGDANGNGSIAINELVRSTGNALNGCGAAAAGE